MRSFSYLAPGTVDEAIAMLRREGSKPIAGGTDLIVLMKQGLIAPSYLIDVANLGLAYVREEGRSLRIGAATSLMQLSESEAIRRSIPVLAEAVEQIGSVQTRSIATIGGNLCSGVPSADTAPPLLVLDAGLKIAGPRGERVVMVKEFFCGPKQTILSKDELLIEIEVPLPPPLAGWGYVKLGRRRAMTLAVVSAATLLWLDADGATFEGGRIALGSVAPTPVRAVEAESTLRGRCVSESTIEEAAGRVVDEIAPIGDLRATAEYRTAVSPILVKRALTQAWQRATEKRAPTNGDANRT